MIATAAPKPSPPPLREWRCPCGALLAKVRPAPGCVVEAVCRRCKRTVRMESP